MSQEFVEFEDVTLIRSTEKAGLFEIEGEEFWLPWSQIDEGSVDKNGESGTLYLAQWLAKEKGLWDE